MKFNLFMGLRNDMLNRAYRIQGVGNRVYIGTKSGVGDTHNNVVEVAFSEASLSKTELTQTVNFLIEKGQTVSEIVISASSGAALAGNGNLGVINLTGDDAVHFEETGAYVIAQLVIELLEVQ